MRIDKHKEATGVFLLLQISKYKEKQKIIWNLSLFYKSKNVISLVKWYTFFEV